MLLEQFTYPTRVLAVVEMDSQPGEEKHDAELKVSTGVANDFPSIPQNSNSSSASRNEWEAQENVETAELYTQLGHEDQLCPFA